MIDIYAFLRRIGIDGSSHIFLHSGYRAFRNEGFSADQVLDAVLGLQDCKATMLPAFNWRDVSAQNPFNVLTTPSIVGALTETFRRRSDVARTLYPTHSCLMAARFMSCFGINHSRSSSPCDRLSPFAAFADHKVRIVLLNCTIDTMTYIHHFEELVFPEHYLSDEIEVVDIIDKKGGRQNFTLRRHRKLPRRFSNFSDALAASPSFRHHKVGEISGWSISADDAAFVISKKFAENIYAST